MIIFTEIFINEIRRTNPENDDAKRATDSILFKPFSGFD